MGLNRPLGALGDRRGARLESWDVVVGPDSAQRILNLRAPEEVVDQIKWLLQENGAWIETTRQSRRSDYNHRIHFTGSIPEAVIDTCRVLRDVLTIPPKHSADFILALDFYTTPDDGLDGELSRTRQGSRVYSVKYQNRSSEDAVNEAKWATEGLRRDLLEVVRRHGIYKQADVLIGVPGHVSAKPSLATTLAREMAELRRVSTVAVHTVRNVRPEAKTRQQDEVPLDLENEFYIRESLEGRIVVIIDDVYRSGATIDAIARAAKRSGATLVLGLVCTRTIRAS